MAKTLQEMKGLVATVALTGSVTPQFSQCLFNMGEWNRVNGLVNVEYRQEHGVLLEAARDAVVMHALQQNYDWILQIDADATFAPDTLGRLLDTAYIKQPDSGGVGAYSQLKPAPYLPTIDTGTGTWEEHYPGEGVLPVIRTGAHCLLVKTWVFRKLPPPWFRTRLAASPVRAFAEVDNFVRQRLNGTNPLTDHPEWGTLMEAALRNSSQPTPIGEDSGFCDTCRAYGVNLYVDTDIVTGHVSQKVIAPEDFAEQLRSVEKKQRSALGVYS